MHAYYFFKKLFAGEGMQAVCRRKKVLQKPG